MAAPKMTDSQTLGNLQINISQNYIGRLLLYVISN